MTFIKQWRINCKHIGITLLFCLCLSVYRHQKNVNNDYTTKLPDLSTTATTTLQTSAPPCTVEPEVDLSLLNKTSWQTVVDGETYVYSAFYENRQYQIISIKIIGITSRLMNKDSNMLYQCYIWDGSMTSSYQVVPSVDQVLQEDHGRE